MAVASGAEFVGLLEQSGLLDAGQLRRVREFAAVSTRPRALAKVVVEQGWLTRWQAQQLLAGRHRLFLGKYKLLENIGEGGMGAVFKAEHPGLGRVVALKVMAQELLRDPEAVARFVREIQSAAALNHPHIVAAYDADRVGNTYFLVMEYVEGDDLKAWIAQHQQLPVAWACECIRQAALGLQHAWENGLVHRDVKPSNLLIVQNDGSPLPHVKILDLGLARFVSDTQEEGGLTRTGQIMGTPDYIAPEQAESTRDADVRADVFSLGCTLFHLLTGRLPFEGNSVMEKLMARVRRDAPPVSSLRPEVAPELDAVVARMLARDPANRYQTPAEVAEALAPFSLGTMPQATEPTILLQPEKHKSPGRVEAKADTTLNRFLENLGSEAVEEPVASPTIESVSPPSMKRPKKTWRDYLHDRNVQVFGGAGMVCLLLAILGSMLFRGNRNVEPHRAPQAAKRDTSKTTPEAAGKELTDAQEQAQAEEAARKKRLAEEEQIRNQRSAAAEAAFPALQAKFNVPGATFATFAKDVAVFNARHGGTPAAIRAAELLMRLPSPLDKLDHRGLPQDCIDHWMAMGRRPPSELVGVLGAHRGHNAAPVRSIDYSPDGKRLAFAGNDGVVTVCDAATLKPLNRFVAHDRIIHVVRFSPDGKWIATGSDDGTVGLLNAMTFDLVFRSKPHGAGVVSLAFSGNGKFLATGSKWMCKLFSVPKGEQLQKLSLFRDWSRVALSPNGDTLAMRSTQGLILWDVAKRSKRLNRDAQTAGPFGGLAISADGKLLATPGPGGKLILIEMETGKTIREIEADLHQYSRIVFSPDGKLLAANPKTPDRSIKVWNVADGKLRATLLGHQGGGIDGLAFSPDGRTLASGAWDHTVRLWDMETGKERFPATAHLTAVAPAPGGRILATGALDGRIRFWNVMTAKPLRTRTLSAHRGAVNSLCYSSKGVTLVSGGADGTVKFWDVASGQLKRTIQTGNQHVLSVSMSPDGRIVASAGYGGTHALQLWDAATGRHLHDLNGHRATVNQVAFGPAGSLIASASEDNSAILWDVATGNIRSKVGAGFAATSVTFHPLRREVVYGCVSSADTVRIWDVDKNSRRTSISGLKPRCKSVAFSPNGRSLAGSGGGRVLLWNRNGAETGVLPVTGQYFPDAASQIAWLPDGRHLATVNGNGTVYIFRVGQRPPMDSPRMTGYARLPNGWTIGPPRNLGPMVNSKWGDGTPALTSDGLTLVFQSNRPRGKGEGKLWKCRRNSRSAPWGPAKNLRRAIGRSEGVNLSVDGNTLVFSAKGPGGLGGYDLWTTTRKSPSHPWGKAIHLGPVLNSSANETGPALLEGGRTLIFASDRSGGAGGFDLWESHRTGKDAWSTPVNMGPTVNSDANESGPTVSGDGRILMFHSDRPNGSGETDLWVSTRAASQAAWGVPVSLAAPLNSPFADDSPSLSADGRTLIFASSRPGGLGGWDLYEATISPSSSNGSYALSFDGKDDYVDIAGLHFDAVKPFTVEAWLQPRRAKGKHVAFFCIGPGGGAYLMTYPKGSGGVVYYGGIIANRSGGLGHRAPDGLMHVAFVSSPTGLLLFANGRKLDGPASLIAKQGRGKARALIGASLGGEPDGPPQRWFHGTIDELRISKTVRYTKNFTPARRFTPDKDTLALYHFDEGQGEKLIDSSGNNHHGNIHGATWVNADGTPIKDLQNNKLPIYRFRFGRIV